MSIETNAVTRAPILTADSSVRFAPGEETMRPSVHDGTPRPRPAGGGAGQPSFHGQDGLAGHLPGFQGPLRLRGLLGGNVAPT
jgi:hypothetical protein